MSKGNSPEASITRKLTATAEEYLNRGIAHAKQALNRGEVDEVSQLVIETLGRLSQSAQEIDLLLGEVFESEFSEP